MSLLGEIRALGTFREPRFVDLGVEHVPFDELTGAASVEQPLLEAVVAGSSAAVTGVRGGGKSSVLAWLCRNLPDDHVPIRVPVVGMDDPGDPAVLGSVALAAALEAARSDDVGLDEEQRQRIETMRADEIVARRSGPKAGAKLGGGPIPAELSAELNSLETEYARGTQPVDRLYGFERLLGIFTYHKLTPVFVLEDTEAALGAGADDASRARFFSGSLKMLLREVEAPAVIAVQQHFVDEPGYEEIRPLVLEITVPMLEDRTHEALRAIVEHRLKPFALEGGVEGLIVPDAFPALAEFYTEKGGSIRHVLAALDVATTAALDSGGVHLEMSHVRIGVEDWRSR